MTCNGDYLCRKRITDSWNKLTVGDVHRTLCKQKTNWCLCETETRENGFLALHFTASKVRTLRHVAHAKILICLTRKLKLTTDGQIFAFLTYFEKYGWPFVSKCDRVYAGFSTAYNGLHTFNTYGL